MTAHDASDDSTPPPLATHEPAPTTTATWAPRACDALTHGAGAPSPNDNTKTPSCDADDVMPLRRAALDSNTEPSSYDAGGIAPLCNYDNTALDDAAPLHGATFDDNTEPASCDAGGVAPPRSRSDAALGGATPPCGIAKHRTEQGGSEGTTEQGGRRKRWTKDTGDG